MTGTFCISTGPPRNRGARDGNARAGGQVDPEGKVELHDVESSADAARNHSHSVRVSGKLHRLCFKNILVT